MPSLSEGFGLSAFEAIAAGVPVVLSFKSGLAEYLLKAINDGIVEPGVRDACIARVIGDDPALIVLEWAEKVTKAILHREEAFRRAETLRTALRPILTWRRAAEDFTEAVLAILD